MNRERQYRIRSRMGMFCAEYRGRWFWRKLVIHRGFDDWYWSSLRDDAVEAIGRDKEQRRKAAEPPSIEVIL